MLWQGLRQVKAKGRAPTPWHRGFNLFLLFFSAVKATCTFNLQLQMGATRACTYDWPRTGLELAILSWTHLYARTPDPNNDAVKYGTHPEGTKLAKTFSSAPGATLCTHPPEGSRVPSPSLGIGYADRRLGGASVWFIHSPNAIPNQLPQPRQGPAAGFSGERRLAVLFRPNATTTN